MSAVETRRCTSLNRHGDPCRARPLPGTDTCPVHTPEHPVAANFAPGHPPTGGGRPQKQRVIDLLRDKIEAEVDLICDPLFGALSVGDGTASDYQVRIAAARELLDRAYGKPRQQVEHSGPDGGPITLAHLAQRAEEDAE